MRNNADIPEKHKVKLYPAVLDLFSKNDFHQVNMRTIAQVSGVSIGTIYKYFPSKEDLLFTVLGEMIGHIEGQLETHLQGLRSFKEIFRKFLWVTLNYYDENPELAVTAFITVPMRTWMQQDAFRTDKRGYEFALQQAHERGDVAEDIDVRRFLDIFLMICYRLIHMWHYFGRRWKLVEAMERDFELYWRMLAPEKG